MSENKSTDPSPADAATDTPPAEHPWFVHIMIGLAVVLFLGTMALLYVAWLSRGEPMAMIVVNGSRSYDGATAVLRNSVQQPIHEPIPLNNSNNYSARLYFTPRRERIELVVIKTNGDREIRFIDPVSAYQMVIITLDNPTTAPATAATTAPAKRP